MHCTSGYEAGHVHAAAEAPATSAGLRAAPSKAPSGSSASAPGPAEAAQPEPVSSPYSEVSEDED